MKELDDFTVERLQRIIRNADGVTSPTYFEVSPADIAALARIALAVKTAEPVYWEIAGSLFTTKEDALKPGYRGTPEPLYEEPVLNSPELPDGWKLLAEQKPEVGDEVIIGASDGSLDVATWCGDHFDDGDFFNHITWPTHWKPRPAPPTAEK